MNDAKDKLSVFEDNDEIMSWCDRDTYKGSETYVHLNGLYGLAVEFSDEITTLRAEVERLRAALESAEAWLERWAVHVGRCEGGHSCTCGLIAIRYEVSAAIAAQTAPGKEEA